MRDGIYWNDESEVYGLFHNGECVMISVMEQDCIDGAIELGMSPSVTN